MLTHQDKINQVYEVLLTPIICCKSYKGTFREGDKIFTGQKYYSGADEDMSDFVIGFYEIIYRDILKGALILDKRGYLENKEFAGDTMNSFNTIANKTPGAGKSRSTRTPETEWPQNLVDYKNFYHCLANFWLLPMDVGRTTRGKLNKAKSPISDYVDRFLTMLSTYIEFNSIDRQYFSCFKDWKDFVDKHFLDEAYVSKELNVLEYSHDESRFIEEAKEKIRLRAKHIAESKYLDELWHYFKELNVLRGG